MTKIGVIVSQFNSAVTDKLLMGAENGLKEADLDYDVIKVPGAFEIPLAAARLADSGDYDALITLGVVIKGDTHHYEMICRACVDGVQRVVLDYKIPIAFEVLMVEDVQLARDRASDSMEDNKGYGAVAVIRQMLS